MKIFLAFLCAFAALSPLGASYWGGSDEQCPSQTHAEVLKKVMMMKLIQSGSQQSSGMCGDHHHHHYGPHHHHHYGNHNHKHGDHHHYGKCKSCGANKGWGKKNKRMDPSHPAHPAHPKHREYCMIQFMKATYLSVKE